MNNHIFYQILDHELPRVIDVASTMVSVAKFNQGSADDGPSWKISDLGTVSMEQHRNPSIEDLYPIYYDRATSLSSDGRYKKLSELRKSIGRLSAAYAISEFEPFAELANALVKQEILDGNLLITEDWITSFSFGDVKSHELESRLSLVEIVLGLELLRGLGRLKPNPLKEIQAKLARRLKQSCKQDFNELEPRGKFAWALEVIVLSLFLDKPEIFEKKGSEIQISMATCLDGLFEIYNGNRSAPKRSEELGFCLDCHFAISHWIDIGTGSTGTVVNAERDRLEEKLGRKFFEKMHQGVWVFDQNQSPFDEVLQDSTVLLIFGDTIDRPDQISTYTRSVERMSVSTVKKCQVITQPLLWFGSAEWNYRPFSNSTNSMRAYLSRH